MCRPPAASTTFWIIFISILNLKFGILRNYGESQITIARIIRTILKRPNSTLLANKSYTYQFCHLASTLVQAFNRLSLVGSLPRTACPLSVRGRVCIRTSNSASPSAIYRPPCMHEHSISGRTIDSVDVKPSHQTVGTGSESGSRESKLIEIIVPFVASHDRWSPLTDVDYYNFAAASNNFQWARYRFRAQSSSRCSA